MKRFLPFDTFKLFIVFHWLYTEHMLGTSPVANFNRKLIFENFNTD